MKLALLSDVHANLEALQAVLDRVAADGAERIVCLGDVVGYHTNPSECIARLRELDTVWVGGSHDRALTGQITTAGFSTTAVRALAWTRDHVGSDVIEFLAALPVCTAIGSDLVAVHGALHPDVGRETVRLDTDERRRLTFEALIKDPSGARVCAFGHTHRIGIYEWRDGVIQELASDAAELRSDAWYLINPGAVGEPRRSDQRASYMIFDTQRRTVCVRRVAYDYAAALAKTRRAGLLPRFSFVPPGVRAVLKRGRRAMGL